MGDWLTPEQRRRNMSAIRSTGTVPERRLLAMLKGIYPHRRIALHDSPPGKPDCYLPALRLAVFADGCYWHGCPEHRRIPEDNREYWTTKLARNRQRDRRVDRELRTAGCSVLRIWEHDLKRPDKAVTARVKRAGSLALKKKTSAGARRIAAPPEL